VTQTATSPQRKPLLDEASFQQLLSAAYVLQEHNDRLRTKEFHEDFAKNLSSIVDTQKLIQTLQLDLPAAAELVADRVQKITGASGTAIGIIDKGQLLYRAGTGSAAVDVGTRVATDIALSADCLTKGSALHYADTAASDSQVRPEIFQQKDVKAFIAVPVYHAGQVAGVLELRFAQPNAFREADLRTAELMAGLLSEAMVTAARMKWKEALASERQSMLEALERIKPQLERLGTEAPVLDEAAGAKSPVLPPKIQPSAVPVADTCSACGSDFFDVNESFCGICGTARPLPSARSTIANKDLASNSLQSKTYAPWLTPYGVDDSIGINSIGAAQESAAAKSAKVPASLQELIGLNPARENVTAAYDKTASDPTASKPVSLGDKTPKLIPSPVAQTAVESPSTLSAAHEVVPDPRTVSLSSDLNPPDSNRPLAQFAPAVESPATGDSLRIVPLVDLGASSDKIQPYPWSSAKKAQHWLETVKAHHGPRAEWVARQWQRRRANVYLVLAAVILLIVISGWGMRPASTAVAGNRSPAGNGQQQAPAQPNLTLFEKFLVSVGLAEAPPAPSYLGNPDTQVWVDVHTALYHCPGTDLYGKTADGRFASQRDAQQDQFEPANRKVCQ